LDEKIKAAFITVFVLGSIAVGIAVLPIFEDKKVETSYFDARDCEIGTSTDEFGVTKCMTKAEYDFNNNVQPRCILSPSLTNDKNYVYDCGDYVSVCDKGQPGEKQTYTGCLVYDKPVPVIKFSDIDVSNETISFNIESRVEGTELGYQKPLPNDHVLIYELLEKITKNEELLISILAEKNLIESLPYDYEIGQRFLNNDKRQFSDIGIVCYYDYWLAEEKEVLLECARLAESYSYDINELVRSYPEIVEGLR